MKNGNDPNDPRRLVEMYLDQTLDPTSREEFLQKVNTDPVWQQAYNHEVSMRDQLKKHIYRPDNSSQLMKAIKNQIQGNLKSE